MNIEDILRSRRSINSFKPERPPEDLIRKAIDVARWAPNHHLTEPWCFYLLGEETKKQVIELNAEIVSRNKGAEAGQKKLKKWSDVPGWLVVTMTKSDDPLQHQEDYAACCCAIHNLSLSLWNEGIGVKWTTGDVIREKAFYDLIWVDPDVETVVGLVWYGYPEVIPESTRCKSLDEILVRLP